MVREHTDRGCRPALQLIEGHDDNFAYVVTPAQRYLGTVSADSLRAALQGHSGPLGLQHAFIPEVSTVPADAPVADLFGQVAQAPCAPAGGGSRRPFPGRGQQDHAAALPGPRYPTRAADDAPASAPHPAASEPARSHA